MKFTLTFSIHFHWNAMSLSKMWNSKRCLEREQITREGCEGRMLGFVDYLPSGRNGRIELLSASGEIPTIFPGHATSDYIYAAFLLLSDLI